MKTCGRYAFYLSFRQTNGFVLVTALLLLLAVTLIAVSLMTSSTLDTKMSIYAQSRSSAEALARGASERAIRFEVDKENDGQNLFTVVDDNNVVIPIDTATVNAQSTLPAGVLSSAGHTLCFERLASSRFRCNQVRIEASVNYGKNQGDNVTVITGVNQQVN